MQTIKCQIPCWLNQMLKNGLAFEKHTTLMEANSKTQENEQPPATLVVVYYINSSGHSGSSQLNKTVLAVPSLAAALERLAKMFAKNSNMLYLLFYFS